MKPEARIFQENGQFSFDIVDLDCIIKVGDDELPEHLFTGDSYTREETAERNADKAIDRFNKATDASQRKTCGYDTVVQCSSRPARGAGFRAGNRNRPVKPKTEG